MEQIITLFLYFIAALFCLAGIVIGVWTAVGMYCEGREVKAAIKRHLK